MFIFEGGVVVWVMFLDFQHWSLYNTTKITTPMAATPIATIIAIIPTDCDSSVKLLLELETKQRPVN